MGPNGLKGLTGRALLYIVADTLSRGSTIRVKKNVYSVPARLIGAVVEARIGAETIEVWYAGERLQQMERLRGQDNHRIDYRHLIAWLVRKPGACARYVYRDDLYPTVTSATTRV